MSVEFDILADLEAQLQQDIPCERCPRPAKVRSFGHAANDCGSGGREKKSPPFYKCFECYLSWRDRVAHVIHQHGHVRCYSCQRDFFAIDCFSNYREF